jgi:hypothetical protein
MKEERVDFIRLALKWRPCVCFGSEASKARAARACRYGAIGFLADSGRVCWAEAIFYAD